MRVHVVWTPEQFADSYRSNVSLLAYLSSDGAEVAYVGRKHSRVTWRPGVCDETGEEFRNYLVDSQQDLATLTILLGEVHLPGGHELTDELKEHIVQLLVLGEEPPGNRIPDDDGSVRLLLEDLTITCHGDAWPGYRRITLDSDGDVIVEHVITRSVLPAAG